MPGPAKTPQGNHNWGLLLQQWELLNKALPGVNNATNYYRIFDIMLTIAVLYYDLIKFEFTALRKQLVSANTLTQEQVDAMSDDQISEKFCKHHLDIGVILQELNKLYPLTITPNIAKCINEFQREVISYLSRPYERHEIYLITTQFKEILYPHMALLNQIFSFIDFLSGPVPNFADDLPAKAADAILFKQELHLAASKESERFALELQKFDPEELIKFANQDPCAHYLYGRAFFDWAEFLICQVSSYFIKFPLENSFHNRHNIARKILREAEDYCKKTKLSTIQRVVDLSQFILSQDIGRTALFTLIVPVLEKVPTIEKFPFEVYAVDKLGRDRVIQKLTLFTQSERYKQFVNGYEPYHTLPYAPHSPGAPRGSRNRHQPLQPISVGEIKMRLMKTPNRALSEVDHKPNVMLEFLNCLRSLGASNNIRDKLIDEIKKLDPVYRVTEEGITKRPSL